MTCFVSSPSLNLTSDPFLCYWANNLSKKVELLDLLAKMNLLHAPIVAVTKIAAFPMDLSFVGDNFGCPSEKE